MANILGVGHYGWWTLRGDWKKHILALRKARVNLLRIFGQYSWPAGRGTYTPFARLTSMELVNSLPWNPPKPGEQFRKDRYSMNGETGYVEFQHRKYPGIVLPVYDLGNLRQEYFERLYELCEFMAKVDMILLWEMEDWCSLKHPGIDKYRHPYFVSPQAHSALTPGGLFGKPILKFMHQYWNRAIDVIKDTNVEVWLSVMNEYNREAAREELTEEEEREAFMDWYIDAQNYMMNAYGGPVVFVGSAMRYEGEISDTCDFYSPHGCGDTKSFNANVRKCLSNGLDIRQEADHMVLSGDGYSTGSNIPDFKGRAGIAPKEVPQIIDFVKTHGFFGYEALIRYKRGHANGTFEEFDAEYGGYAICEALGAGLGLDPWEPPENPPEPPKPPIEPPPPPDLPISFWEKVGQGFRRAIHWCFGKNSLIAKFFKLFSKKT